MISQFTIIILLGLGDPLSEAKEGAKSQVSRANVGVEPEAKRAVAYVGEPNFPRE